MNQAMLYRHAIRPLLFHAGGGDPEAIHERMLRGLALVSRSPALVAAMEGAASLSVGGGGGGALSERWVFGLRFPNAVGLAAGFDKNAVALPALAALGFGFIEAGTITRYAQPGNPRPRLFRVATDEALINRMGFNNAGAGTVAARLASQPRLAVPLGISLGKSKVTPLEDAVGDYLASLELLYAYGDYFAVNVSSPNTPGLRELQERERLDRLLAALQEELRRRATAEGRAVAKPLLVKVAPDLSEAALEELVGVCLARAASGLIAVNTTVSREALSAQVAQGLRSEGGGLSGRPLHALAVRTVARLARLGGGRLPIIGCGGIFDADDAARFFDAGAALVQLYTGFIYEGPLVARRIARGLAERVGG